jgi:hypothetical protein
VRIIFCHTTTSAYIQVCVCLQLKERQQKRMQRNMERKEAQIIMAIAGGSREDGKSSMQLSLLYCTLTLLFFITDDAFSPPAAMTKTHSARIQGIAMFADDSDSEDDEALQQG